MTTREILKNFDKKEAIKLYNLRKTNEEAYELFKQKGLTDSYEVFLKETQNYLLENATKLTPDELLKQIEGAELSDVQLEQIAGGKGGKETNTDSWDAVSTMAVATGGVIWVSMGAACI